MYFFVHNSKLRSAYDTYKVIENLRNSGFKDIVQDVQNNTTIILRNDNKKGKK